MQPTNVTELVILKISREHSPIHHRSTYITKMVSQILTRKTQYPFRDIYVYLIYGIESP